jgi:cysteine desulfurase
MEIKKRVYLDYSATTPVKQEVLEKMLPYFTEHYGNPSSLYTIGQESKEAVARARDQVASLIGAEAREIFFTASGTEADNWAFIETAMWRRDKGKHIITTKIEHPAMLRSAEFLEKEGFEVTLLDVDESGFVSLEQVRDAIRPDTTLLSVMFANNEIGTVQPIAELAEIAHENGAIFHTDAVQALGNVPIDVAAMGIDLMSMSAHKIYGPKGVGALYVKKSLNLPAHIHGGGQESKKRAGTENLAGLVGFGAAAELAKKNLPEHVAKLTELRNYFLGSVKEIIEDIRINGDLEHRLPGNINITFKYIEGEAILLLLDMKGIYVSTGSACSSASLTPSHVLEAIGVPMEEIHGSIRFTIGDFTTKEDLDYVVGSLVEVVAKLRGISSLSSESGF